jgi:N-acetylneuraminate synthase
MSEKVLIIAEAGVNHNGSVERAIEMIDVALEAGADIIKFQTFSADKLARKDAQLAEYQKKGDGDTRSQWDLLKGLELSHEEFARLRDHAKAKNIGFLSTGFDLDELAFLIDELHIPLVKVASGDLTFAPMLVEAGLSNLPVILSTGMANIAEIEQSLKFIAFGYAKANGYVSSEAYPSAAELDLYWDDPRVEKVMKQKCTILHCTTQYPAELDILNLKAIKLIADEFGLPVGYSDHSAGILASTIAVALGATVIEKHFTLDKTLEGPDHEASLDPTELKAMIDQIRLTTIALGKEVKECQPIEVSNKAAVRRSLVAKQPIAAGAVITEADLECRRPGAGRTSFDFYEVIGSVATQDYAIGEYVGQ